MERLWCASVTHFGASEEGVTQVDAVKKQHDTLNVYHVESLDCDMLFGVHLFKSRQEAVVALLQEVDRNITSAFSTIQ